MPNRPRRSKLTQSAQTRELMPGDVIFAHAGDRLKTLLGSCVAVILTDPRRTVAAMCHVVHVGPSGVSHHGDTAYGEEAMKSMFNMLHKAGVFPRLCDAYVYGGGTMFPYVSRDTTVGSSNVNWVRNFLAREGIKILEEHSGVGGYCKVFWEVGTGEPVIEIVPVDKGSSYAG